MAKLEQLKQIADDLDSKITPLLNADQQKKFQEIREQHRRELMEKYPPRLCRRRNTGSAASSPIKNRIKGRVKSGREYSGPVRDSTEGGDEIKDNM